jgi:hypothetical protein
MTAEHYCHGKQPRKRRLSNGQEGIMNLSARKFDARKQKNK